MADLGHDRAGVPDTVPSLHPFNTASQQPTFFAGAVLIEKLAFAQIAQRGNAGMRVHAKPRLAGLGLEAEMIEEDKRLEPLAQVAGTHQARDRPVSATVSPVNNDAPLRGAGNGSAHATSRAVLRALAHQAMSSSKAVAACARCGKSSNCLPCCQRPRNSTMPMCTALRTGAICSSVATRRNCSIARAAPTPP